LPASRRGAQWFPSGVNPSLRGKRTGRGPSGAKLGLGGRGLAGTTWLDSHAGKGLRSTSPAAVPGRPRRSPPAYVTRSRATKPADPRHAEDHAGPGASLEKQAVAPAEEVEPPLRPLRTRILVKGEKTTRADGRRGVRAGQPRGAGCGLAAGRTACGSLVEGRRRSSGASRGARGTGAVDPASDKHGRWASCARRWRSQPGARRARRASRRESFDARDVRADRGKTGVDYVSVGAGSRTRRRRSNVKPDPRADLGYGRSGQPPESSPREGAEGVKAPPGRLVAAGRSPSRGRRPMPYHRASQPLQGGRRPRRAPRAPFLPAPVVDVRLSVTRKKRIVGFSEADVAHQSAGPTGYVRKEGVVRVGRGP